MASNESNTRSQLMRFFEAADVDKSGYLSSKELKAALAKQGYDLSREKLKKQFLLFDKNGDKKVSRDEFLVGMGVVPEPIHQSSMIRKMFLAYDKNGDGFIDRSELTQVFKAMNKGKLTVDVDKIMSLIDVDKSGKLDYNEFLAFFEKTVAT